MTEILTPERYGEYDAFVASHPKGHFMQSREWAKVKSAWRWDAIVRRGEDGAITGTLALLTRKIPGLPTSLCYGCRGPVCGADDRQTLSELIDAAVAYAKKRRAYILKLDPDIPSSDAAFADFLVSKGFARPADSKNFEGIQPRYVFRLNTAGQTAESLMAAFESKTRYNIRLAQRKGVTVRVGTQADVADFSRIMRQTGERDNFLVRDDGYFSNMLSALGEHARLYMAFYEDKPVAGTLAIGYGDKVWYLYGASSNESRNVMPNYLLQWEMISWALERGARLYDFRGVSGDLTEDNPLYGLYRFKKGFSGEFTEFAGEFDMVLSPGMKKTVEFAKRASSGLRRLGYKLHNRKQG